MRYPITRLCLPCLTLCMCLLGANGQAQSAEEAAIPVRKNSGGEATAQASSKPSVITRLQSASRGEKPAPVEPAVSSPDSGTRASDGAAAKAGSTSVPSPASSQKSVKVSAPARQGKAASATKRDSAAASAKAKEDSTAGRGKTASSSTEAKKSETASKSIESSTRSSEPSEADLALVKGLESTRKESPDSRRESSTDDSEKSDKRESAESGSVEKSVDSSGAAANEEPSPYSAAALAASLPKEVHDDHGEEGNLAAEIATVPAPPINAPNLYLPQPQEKTGLFSRLFGREPRPTQRGQSTPFSSDYATRGDAILPAVITGNGFNGRDLPIGQEDQYRLAGLTSEFRPTDLVQVPVNLCHYGNQLYLRQEPANSLCRMISDAANQGLCLRVVSAYRDYGHQLRLYNQAVSRGGPNQKSVARPGKSEHHLGTTVDLTNNETHALRRSFGNTPEGRWLAANAHRYGWKLTVMSDNARRSHNDEPWHLRYLGSHVNAPAGISNIASANQRQQSQRRSVLGSVSRLLRFGRN